MREDQNSTGKWRVRCEESVSSAQSGRMSPVNLDIVTLTLNFLLGRAPLPLLPVNIRRWWRKYGFCLRSGGKFCYVSESCAGFDACSRVSRLPKFQTARSKVSVTYYAPPVLQSSFLLFFLPFIMFPAPAPGSADECSISDEAAGPPAETPSRADHARAGTTILPDAAGGLVAEEAPVSI